MVYSAAFDALPAPARERIYRRLYDLLTGALPYPRRTQVSGDDRRAIVEILRDTKPQLPEYWSGREPP
jgi:hypothetical protein